MHCLKCGAYWKSGNAIPIISKCPVCDTDYNKETEFRGYDSINEFLMCLLLEKGEEICLNDLQITSFLNDYYPQEVLLREQIEKLLSNGIGAYIYQYRKGINPNPDLQTIVKRSELDNIYDSINNTVGYLTGQIVNEGSKTETTSFYLNQEKKLYDDKYRLLAMEKAYKISPEAHILKRQAEILFDIGSNNKAVELLEKVSETDDEEAILWLAGIYEKGDKTSQNYESAVKLYLRLEGRNSAEGMFHLGKLYYWGYGVQKNTNQAVEYLSRSAEQGNYKAQYLLYRILYKDNPAVATGYLSQSSAQKFEPAMYDMAIHLLYGDDVEKDVPSAVGLLEECEKRGNRDAASKLFYMYMTGYEVEMNKSKAQQYRNTLGE